MTNAPRSGTNGEHGRWVCPVTRRAREAVGKQGHPQPDSKDVTVNMETDIGRIEELTRRGEDENRRFRNLLERCNLKTEEIDAIVHRHLREVSEQIECRECGNCCKVFRPELAPHDIVRLAGHLGIPKEEFIAEYIVEYETGKGLFFKCAPCPFLRDNACTVYPGRPDVCRAYPTLHREGFIQNLGITFSNCSVCPIVYNVYDRVKMEIGESRATALPSEVD